VAIAGVGKNRNRNSHPPAEKVFVLKTGGEGGNPELKGKSGAPG